MEAKSDLLTTVLEGKLELAPMENQTRVIQMMTQIVIHYDTNTNVISVVKP